MNKQIIFLTSFILCSLTTHSNFGMSPYRPLSFFRQNKPIVQEEQPTFPMLIINRSDGRHIVVNIKYNKDDNTFTLDDIKDAASKAFQLDPDQFFIIFAGHKLHENEKFDSEKYRRENHFDLILVRK